MYILTEKEAEWLSDKIAKVEEDFQNYSTEYPRSLDICLHGFKTMATERKTKRTTIYHLAGLMADCAGASSNTLAISLIKTSHQIKKYFKI